MIKQRSGLFVEKARNDWFCRDKHEEKQTLKYHSLQIKQLTEASFPFPADTYEEEKQICASVQMAELKKKMQLKYFHW